MKIGFLGGTFDPIHTGHIAVANQAAEAMGLDIVYLLPTAQNYQKATTAAPAKQRLAWVTAAVAEHPKLGVLPTDLRAGHIYTTQTIEILRTQFPADEFYWIVGADQLANLWTWKNIETLVTQTAFIAVARTGFALKIPQIKNLKLHTLTRQELCTSSTQIRQLAAEGKSLEGLIPADMENEIAAFYTNQTAKL